MKEQIRSFRDLEVYQRLFKLHLEVDQLTHTFPKHEMYELGSQLRRSSNSIPANIAEGWNNKHTKIYLEGINRAIGELQETQHHLDVAVRKGYMDQARHTSFLERYEECQKMLWGLTRAVAQLIEFSDPLHLSPNT